MFKLIFVCDSSHCDKMVVGRTADLPVKHYAIKAVFFFPPRIAGMYTDNVYLKLLL